MKASVLRVRAESVESVLDRLLPLVPAGVYVEGDELLVVPARDDLADAAGDDLLELAERELPDDPEQRIAVLLQAPVVGGRFVVRSPSAPPPSDPSLEDIVVERGSAFGTGLHPTTQRCLELMLALEPGGSFADLGCGTGVLSIAAARLGWEPVVAVDYDEASVDSARANAERNAVVVEARQADLLAEPPPAADTVVANVPVHVHRAVRERLERPPRRLIASGVSPDEADEVVAAYAGLGLVERRRYAQSGWAAVLLAAGDEPVREAAAEADRRREQPLAEPAERLPSTLPGQLETEVPGGGVAFSCSRELPTGARVAAILAPGLFRVDVRHLEDTLVISVRNLSPEPLRFLPDRGPPRTIVTTAETALKRPLATNARMRLLVGTREAKITLSALSGLSPVSGRIVAQAIVGAG
ncbi:MAG: 50S ribosomal protein L11 methyltransferase [Gaiellaceae bacterium]